MNIYMTSRLNCLKFAVTANSIIFKDDEVVCCCRNRSSITVLIYFAVTKLIYTKDNEFKYIISCEDFFAVLFESLLKLTLKAPNKNCSRRHFNFLLLPFKDNTA